MIGPEGIARGIANGLYLRMPLTLQQQRERLDIGLYELPDLVDISPTEINIRAINAFPVAAVVEYDTSGRIGNRNTDMDSTFDEYSYRYRMRVFLWCASDDIIATDLMRKRLILAAREALLIDKIVVPDSNGNNAQLDAITLKESFSDVGQLEENQFIGGAYLEFEVVSHERLGAWPEPPAEPAVIFHEENITPESDTHPIPHPEAKRNDY